MSGRGKFTRSGRAHSHPLGHDLVERLQVVSLKVHLARGHQAQELAVELPGVRDDDAGERIGILGGGKGSARACEEVMMQLCCKPCP